MYRPLELFIGLRYTRAKRRNHFISFISFTSMLGVVIGVWALITVLSVMNGFEQELRDRILSVASHVTILGRDGRLTDWQAVANRVADAPDVVAEAPYVFGQGMLTNGGRVSGAVIRGVEPKREREVSKLLQEVDQGSSAALTPGSFGIILGRDLAFALGVTVGNKVTLVVPNGQVTPAGLLPRLRRFTVVGIFNAGMYEYDSSLALMNMEDAARLFRLGNAVSGVRLKLDDIFSAPRVRRQLASLLGNGVVVRDWTQDHANFFRALKIERRVMFIILSLIVAVAAFNIVSTLVMVVTDKQADVAILRTLGISPRSVMGIFVIQGTVIGTIGTLAGGVLGVITALNVKTIIPFVENLLHTKFFPADVYVISEFPAQLRWHDVVQIMTAAFIMSLLATLYPAWRAARVQPADALRYE